jgi:MFS family permease
MTRFRDLRHNHDFTVLWIGQTISELGSRMSMFVFPLLAWAITGSAMWAAAAESAHVVGMVAMLLPAGVVADRTDRRRLMRTASATGLLLYLSLVVAQLSIGISIVHLLVVAVLTGAGAGLFAPAETSAVRTVVTDEHLSTALAQNQARQHVASLVGGPLGGALFSLARWVPFAVDAASYAVSWVLLGRIRTDLSAVESGPRLRLRQSMGEGFRFIMGQPLFRVLLVWSSLVNLLVNALFFLAVLRLLEGGFAPVQIGLVETSVGFFGVLGAIAAPWMIERTRTGTMTVLIAWSFAPLAVPMIFWNQPLVVAATLSAGLFLNPAGNAGIGAYRMARTPRDLQGRIQSTNQFCSMLSIPLAPLLAGGLLAGLGGPVAVASLAVLTGLAALIPTLSTTVRSVPRPAVWRAELRASGESRQRGREGAGPGHAELGERDLELVGDRQGRSSGLAEVRDRDTVYEGELGEAFDVTSRHGDDDPTRGLAEQVDERVGAH